MIYLNLNEPFGTGCSAAIHRYPNHAKLRSLLAKHHGVNEDNILLLSGADQGIDIVFRMLNPGSGVTMLAPDFPRYEILANLNHHQINKILFFGFQYPDPQMICRSLHATNSKLFITSTVSNPVGCVIPPIGIEILLEKKPKTCFLVIDEVYSPFIGQDSAQFIASSNEDILSLNSFSKMGYPGIRVGYVIANKKVIENLEPYISRFGLSTHSIEMAEKLLISQEWRRLVSEQINAREWLVAQLLKRGFTVRDSSANWILLYLAESAAHIVSMLQDRNYLIQLQAQPELKGWVRISTPAEKEILTGFLKTLDEVLSVFNRSQRIAA